MARTLALLTLLPILLSACALNPWHAEPPRVSLSDIRMVDAGVLEQHFRVKMRIQNPNPDDLDVRGIDVSIDVNGKGLLTGSGKTGTAVPALGNVTLEIDAYSTLAGLARQLGQLSQGGTRALSYRMHGVVFVGDFGRRLGFEDAGEVEIPGLPGG